MSSNKNYENCKNCEEYSDNSINNTRLCEGGCGFYGSKNLNYYCSTCSKNQNVLNSDVDNTNVDNTNVDKILIDTDKSVLNENTKTIVIAKKVNKKRKRTRCHMCRKKLPLHMIFKCTDCKTITCSVHRYHEEHNCPMFNKFLERKNKALKHSMPTIIASKIEKI
jgi:predicted nucleic acid binding AN1-type Zn finger protein